MSFDFGAAIVLLKSRRRVARAGWNGKGMWLLQINDYTIGATKELVEDVPELLPWIGMKTADKKFVPWLASQTDILAEDWVEV